MADSLPVCDVMCKEIVPLFFIFFFFFWCERRLFIMCMVRLTHRRHFGFCVLALHTFFPQNTDYRRCL